MKSLGIGLIGLGYIGKVHLRSCSKLTNANLVAVSDVSKRALNQNKNCGAKYFFANYEDLLKNPEVDSVIIALPTHLHLECAIKAAEAGKHILLEKPIARNVEDAKKILTAARKSSVKLVIGYPLRFVSTFRDLKETLTNGSLGGIEIAYATNISSGPFFHRAEGYNPAPVPDWWWNKELTGGGALIDLGSHMINLLRWYFGEITDIKSDLGYRFNLDLEDSAICMAKFESGTRAVISVGWFSEGYKTGVELFGTVANASHNNTFPNPIQTAIQLITTGVSKSLQPNIAEIQQFINCVAFDSKPSSSGEDGLKDLEAISLAYKNQINLI